MKSYLITIIIVSIAMGVCEMLAPSRKSIGKYSKIIGMLVVLCVLIEPLTTVISTINGEFLDKIKDEMSSFDDTDEDYEQYFEDYLTSFSKEEYEGQIKSLLHEKYGIPKDECEVKIEILKEDAGVKVKMIRVLLSGKSIFKNPYEIEAYVKSLTKVDCSVLIK